MLLRGLIVLSVLAATSVKAYNRVPCNREARAQFQFPDCFAPPLNPELMLTQASFLMAHDAATGYIIPNQPSASGMAWWYAKNQAQSVTRQLNNGARALDLRVRLLANNSVSFHHGSVPIPILLEKLVDDVLEWTSQASDEDELVLLFNSHFAYQNETEASDVVTALANVYQTYGIEYISCEDAYELTVGDALELGALSSGGASVLAIDQKDGSGSFCGKDNWLEPLVTCYPRRNESCTKSWYPHGLLNSYMKESANSEATDSGGTLGPPASDMFWQVQALWQITPASAAFGVARFSNLLMDVRDSGVNRYVAGMIQQEAFQALNLFTVDHVAVDGNAILSVLRNQCGQNALGTACGSALAPPPVMRHVRLTTEVWISLAMVACLIAICTRWYIKRPRWLLTLISRLRQDYDTNCNSDTTAADDNNIPIPLDEDVYNEKQRTQVLLY